MKMEEERDWYPPKLKGGMRYMSEAIAPLYTESYMTRMANRDRVDTNLVLLFWKITEAWQISQNGRNPIGVGNFLKAKSLEMRVPRLMTSLRSFDSGE